VSGFEGGGNQVHQTYQNQSTPTVIVITPDRLIVYKSIWEPTQENITAAVIDAGGLIVGIEDNDISGNDISLKIYPNPIISQATLSFDIDANAYYGFEIYNLVGHKVFETDPVQLQGGHQEINLSLGHLTSGLYFIRVVRNGKVLETNKLMIQ